MSNGRNFCIVATAAPKDEYGRSFAADSSAAGRIDLAPTDSGDALIKAIGASTGAEDGMIVMTFESELCKYSEKVSLPMQLMITDRDDRKNSETDAEFEVKIEKNFDDMHFVSSEGEQLELCDFGLRVTDVRFDEDSTNAVTIGSCLERIELDFADGSRTVLDDSADPEGDILDISNISVTSGDDLIIEGSVSFGHLIDSRNVTAVTICGKKFTVQ